jgi:hypothetical protein
LGAIKPKGLNRINRIAKIGYGYLCLREENLISCKVRDVINTRRLLSHQFCIYVQITCQDVDINRILRAC